MFGLFKRSEQTVIKEPVIGGKVRRFNHSRPMSRSYDAGKIDRLTESWSTQPMNADQIIDRNQMILVARSREQAANNGYAKSFLRMCRQNIVGETGIQLQAQAKDPGGKLDAKANQAIEKAWRKWCKRKNCDLVGQMSFRAMQEAAVTSAAKDGEFIFQKVYGNQAGPFGFALLLLDPQRMPVHFTQIERPGGNFIRQGIEFTAQGKPVAYYFTTGDARDSDYSYAGQNYRRVPAEDIIHGFFPDIIGQKRGLPWMATALARMRHLTQYESAALINAEVSAKKSGFLQWKDGEGPEDSEADDEEVFMEAEAGTFQELPPGLELKEWNPQYPSGEYQQFHKSMLRGIASGLGVAYNNLANDLEGVNYSSIRQGTLDEREHWKALQVWLCETLLDDVFESWLPRALLRGIPLDGGAMLRVDKLEKYQEISWQPRRWLWIDPNADAKAAVTAKNNLLQSPSKIIRDQGLDPDSVWREFARDIDSMRDAGLDDTFILATLNIKPEGESNADNEKPASGSGTDS